MFSLAEENIFFYFTLCLKIKLPRKQNLTMAKLRHFCICVARMPTHQSSEWLQRNVLFAYTKPNPNEFYIPSLYHAIKYLSSLSST